MPSITEDFIVIFRDKQKSICIITYLDLHLFSNEDAL